MLLLRLIFAGESVSDRQFDGTIDDVRIYNHAFPFSDIKTIYNSGTTLPPPPSSTKVVIGDRVRVSSGPLNAGSNPSTRETLLGTQVTNAQGTVAGGPTNGHGYHWRNINYDTDVDGNAEDFLVTEPPAPPPSSESTYYVAKNGNDSNSGTSLSAPFQTIQKCASVMIQGNTCYVRAGTYRETITPANSGTPSAPIAFQPYEGESVTISGADVISGWSVYRDAIYESSSMNWDLGQGKNQIFVDGQMMTEARWPNTGTDLSNPTWAVATGGSSDRSHPSRSPINPNERWTITDSALDQPAGFWNGALINHLSNSGWTTQSGIVTSYTPGSVTFSLLSNRYGVGKGTKYYLTGKLGALDTAREWFFDPAVSTLYLWTPVGDDPSSHVVEAKRRQYTFDLSGKSNITIGAFNIFAAGIKSDMSSSHITIDGINASYVSHLSRVEGPGWVTQRDTGIMLHGTSNVLQNCTIAFSAANGVDLYGTNHKVTNCTIHDVNYLALNGAAIYTQGRTDRRLGLLGFPNSGHEISYNTLYNSGRFLVFQAGQAMKITHNHMYNASLQTQDSGIYYTHSTDGGGTEIAYNLVHDNRTSPSGDGIFSSFGWGPGIYLDNDSSNFLIHHNVVWNTPSPGIFLNTVSSNQQIYNNTLWNNGDSAIMGGDINVKVYNNFSDRGFSGTDVKNNLTTSDPRFVDSANGNFQLQSGSPAIDQGIVISGFTDGYVGSAPDIGAYEFGVQAWKAGANTGTQPPTPPSPIGNSTEAQEQQSLILQEEETTEP